MKKRKEYFRLFFTMLKIGAFTFGGGYAMIALLERELVEKKNWLTGEEFSDMVAVAESTPGPVAVNAATYVGYRKGGVFGAFLSTLAVCLPSFIVIYLISLFFNEFLSLKYVEYAFRGIRVCVTFLVLSAGIKMFLQMKKNLFNLLVFGAVSVAVVLLFLFGVDFSSIWYILAAAVAGVAVYLTGLLHTRKANEKNAENEGKEK